jgi:hypothetical protein
LAAGEGVKWLRAFFWVGKKQVSGGHFLVAWESICRPLCYGGLGIKNMLLKSLAMREWWEWLSRTNANKAWQGLPMLKDPKVREVF